MKEFFHTAGKVLIAGSLLWILINVFLTPFYLASFDQGEAHARLSNIHFIRLSAALLELLLLLYGSFGLYLSQKSSIGKFGGAAYLVLFVGICSMFAIEWANLFVLRALAQTSPDALNAVNDTTLVTVGFASGAALFMLGWIFFTASLWRGKLSPRWAAPAVIAGLILIPILGVSPLGILGQVIGNAVFGIGLFGLGRSLRETG